MPDKQSIQSFSHSDPTEVEKKLRRLVCEELLERPANFPVDANLYEAGLDSIAIMRLLVLIENEFEVSLDEADLSRENFACIRSLAAIIRERIVDK